MSKEIIINSDEEQTRIAIVENGELVELYIETQEHERTIGNLFLGRIRKIMPSIQAAFVDIGQKQDAFLHFSDLIDNLPDWLAFVREKEPNVSNFKADYLHRPVKVRRHHPSGKKGGGRASDSDDDLEYEVEETGDGSSGKGRHHVTDKKSRGKRRSAQHGHDRGKQDEKKTDRSQNHTSESADPSTFLKRDLPILVRISKEPIQSKGSRITTDISLAGRFLVLVPMANYVAVSKKIMSFKERRRLRVLAKSLVPDGFGVIVRTVADGRNAKALDTDLRLLIEKWRTIEQKLTSNHEPPSVIHEDVNMVSSIIRDLFSEDYDRILIDSQRLYRNIRGYIQAVAPQMAAGVQLHRGNQPVFRAAKIDREVEQAFQSRVDLPSGGYLFIEQTEAMHVVDVNSGRAGKGLTQEENSVRVNLEAVMVISRQVRLRDLGGIIVVDFIDMRDDRNRRKIHDQLRREFRKDRAVTKVLPMSDFGLIQITRQRLRPSITTTFSMPEEKAGPDKAREHKPEQRRGEWHKPYPPVAPEDLVRKIEDWLEAFKESGRRGPVKLLVHPFTAAYLNRRTPNQTTRWSLKHFLRIRVDSDPHVDPMAFRFFDGRTGKEISSRPDKLRKNGRRNQPGRAREKSNR
ncbi:MAG: Rne/Rng family ribonuclease [Bacteroidetes bacterium]|nr:Rne/Rng family ribonuclease [Bacteroidota bacterium]